MRPCGTSSVPDQPVEPSRQLPPGHRVSSCGEFVGVVDEGGGVLVEVGDKS